MSEDHLRVQLFNVCHFHCMAIEGGVKVEPVKQVKNIICMAEVTPTDRPKSNNLTYLWRRLFLVTFFSILV